MLGLCVLGLVYQSLAQADSVAAVQQDSVPPKRFQFTTYPVLGFQPETSFLLGSISFILFNLSDSIDKEFHRPSSLAPVFIYTFNKQIIITPRLELNFTNRYQVKLKTTYRHYPNEFYGVGNSATLDDLELYTEDRFTVESRFYRITKRKLFTGLYVFLENYKVSDTDAEGQLATNTYVGENGGFNLGVGPSIKYDVRDDIIFPTKGYLLSLEALFYPPLSINDYDFRFYELEARKYMHLGEKNVFAFRARLSGHFGNESPFYQYPKLGGSQRLRGIRVNQFLERKTYMMQAEHRLLVYKRWGLNFAVGVGDAANELPDFKLQDVKYSLSGGIRFRLLSEDRLNLAVDYGLTQGGQTGFYLAIGEAF